MSEFIVQIRAYLTVHSALNCSEINALIAGRVNDQKRVAWFNRNRCTKARWMIVNGRLVTDEPRQEATV